MSEAKTTPLRAIRAKCMECSCGNTAEVRNCVIPRCPLYPYRFGHNPARAGIGSKSPAFLQKASSTSDSTQSNRSKGEDATGNSFEKSVVQQGKEGNV